MNNYQQNALNNILSRLIVDTDIIGIMLIGSLANNKGHVKSDIDFYVVAQDGIDKTTTEYFENCFVQIQWRSLDIFSRNVMKINRHIPFCIECQILLDRTGDIEINVKRGRKAAECGPRKLDAKEIAGIRLVLTQDFDLIQGMILQKRDADAAILLNELLMEALSALYDYHGWWLPLRKKIISDFCERDIIISQSCKEVVLNSSITTKLQHLKIIIDHVLSLIGGELREIEIIF